MYLGFFDLTGPTVVDFESERVIIRRLNSYTVHVRKRGLGHQLAARQGLDVGLDDERRLRLPDEDVGAHRQRLRPGGPQRALHDPGHALHDLLHDPQIVQDRHHRREHDDRRQDVGEEEESMPVQNLTTEGEHLAVDEGSKEDVPEMVLEDDDIETAVEIGGANDRAIDFFWIDDEPTEREAQSINWGQAKFSETLDRVFDSDALDHFGQSIGRLEDSPVESSRAFKNASEAFRVIGGVDSPVQKRMYLCVAGSINAQVTEDISPGSDWRQRNLSTAMGPSIEIIVIDIEASINKVKPNYNFIYKRI